MFASCLVLPVAALDLSAIPDNINTYERLAVWVVQCLQSSANGDQVNVVENQGSVPVAQAQVAVTADNVDRFVLTAYIPYDLKEFNSGDNKTWMSAKDVSSAAPHANLLSN